MKKILLLTSSVLMLFLVACTSAYVVEPNGNQPETESEIVNDATDVDDDLDEPSIDEHPFTPQPFALGDVIFFGDGRSYSLDGYWLGDVWDYDLAFALSFSGVCGSYMDYIGGQDIFREWTDQFVFHGGERDSNEANFRTFADDFGLTVDDFIWIHEQANGMSIAESDELILWAREIFEIDSFAVDENGNRADSWDHRMTSAEIRARLSDCIYEVWEHFPGHGVIQNGHIYTPAWIIQNIDLAILEKGIPIEEITRILEWLSDFPQMTMEVELALEELETAQDVLESR